MKMIGGLSLLMLALTTDVLSVVLPPFTAHRVFPYSISEIEDNLANADDDGVTSTNDDDDKGETDDFRIKNRAKPIATPTRMPTIHTGRPTHMPTPLPAPEALTMAQAIEMMEGKKHKEKKTGDGDGGGDGDGDGGGGGDGDSIRR
jgi:hypothetical protein